MNEIVQIHQSVVTCFNQTQGDLEIILDFIHVNFIPNIFEND